MKTVAWFIAGLLSLVVAGCEGLPAGKKVELRVTLSGFARPSGEVSAKSASLFRLLSDGSVSVGLLVSDIMIERPKTKGWYRVKMRELSAERDFHLEDGDKLSFLDHLHENG
jgi:hypothetical protein